MADFYFYLFSSIIQKTSEAKRADTPTVERDFSACGNLLLPNRSRIDTYWVEMVMLDKANFEHIPDYGIAAKDIRACMCPGAVHREGR